MNNPVSQIEQQLASLSPGGAPGELRETVLANVRRELRSSRWDHRLGRAAALVFTMGVAINAAMAFGLAGDPHSLRKPASEASLVQTAVAVAHATDAETGRQVAWQLATWGGHSLTSERLSALEAALDAELRKDRED